MKMYSDAAITREEVQAIVADVAGTVQGASNEALRQVDDKQTLQIKQLRVLIVISFACNLIITLSALGFLSKHL